MWTAENVASFLSVSVSWVRHRVAENRIPHHRIGGWIVRFDPAEIRGWATGFIASFLEHLESTRGNSVRTRNMRLAAIRSFFR